MQRTASLRGFNSGFFANALFFATNYKLEAAKHTPKTVEQTAHGNATARDSQAALVALYR
jgi:hypothetical protein